MPRFGQYAFYIVVACISLILGTLPLVLSGFVSLVLIWYLCAMLYGVLVVKKKAPIIEIEQLLNKKKTNYNITTLNPVMLDSLNDLVGFFSKGNSGTPQEITQSFCHYFGLPTLRNDPFLLAKKILFEYQKQTGSLQKKVIQLNKIKLESLLSPLTPTEKLEFQSFCKETENF